MRRSIPGLVLTLSLLLGASALAANERRLKPADYQEVSEEDRAAARAKSRNSVNAWRETDLPPEYKFPWMPLGFTVLTLGIAIPFAWSAYKRHAREQSEINAAATTAVPRKRSKTAPVEE